MEKNDQTLINGIQEALDLLKDYGKAKLIQQCHNATGDGINSLNAEVDKIGLGFMGSVVGRKYLLAQDTGIQGGRYAKGKEGDLVKAIIQWIKDKEISIAIHSKGKLLSPSKQTPKNLSYLIIRTHKIHGMHTTGGSRDLSKQGWIGQAITDKQREVFEIIENAGFKYFDDMIKSMVDEAKRNK